MKRILLPMLAAALLLTGCGKTPAPAATGAASPATEAPAPTETPAAPTAEPVPDTAAKGRVTRFENSIEADPDGDGISETVTLEAPLNEYDAFESLIVSAGEKSCERECYGYSVTGYLVETAEGGCFLYAEVQTDNDYRFIEVFRLSADGIEHAGSFDGGFVAEPTDPAAMRMGKRVALLSTYGAEGIYAVDAYGEPKLTEPYLTIENSIVLTTIAELTCDIVDEADAFIEQRTLPIGTKLTFARTDGVRLLDMRLDSGELCRLNVSREWPQTVNGLEAESVFDGMMFAG